MKSILLPIFSLLIVLLINSTISLSQLNLVQPSTVTGTATPFTGGSTPSDLIGDPAFSSTSDPTSTTVNSYSSGSNFDEVYIWNATANTITMNFTCASTITDVAIWNAFASGAYLNPSFLEPDHSVATATFEFFSGGTSLGSENINVLFPDDAFGELYPLTGTYNNVTQVVMTVISNHGGNETAMQEIAFNTDNSSSGDITPVITGTTAICAGSSQTYSVTNVAGVTYSWSYSGAGTASSSTNSVTFNPMTSGTLTVTANNACGASASSTFAITVDSAIPVQPSVISGASNVCNASSQTYSVTNVAGVTYSWSYSGSGTASSSTNSVTFNPTTSGTLTVTANNACGASASSTFAITVDAAIPVQPSVISGANNVCTSTSQSYSVTNVAGVSYTWSYSGGGTPTSSTNSVTFNPTSSGTLSVTATNTCGTSTSSTFAIVVDAATPLEPSVISGASAACIASSQTYSVVNVAGVTYSWSYSGGGTASSSTNSVTFNPTTSGTLSVTAANACGTSTSSTYAITVDAAIPIQPSAITGTNVFCIATSQTYSVTNVAGVTYSWSYSGGGTATSTTNSVTFNPITSGTLSVTATNACGSSASSTYAITVDAVIPMQPAVIAGTTAVCEASSQTYSVTNVSGVSYTWSYTGGGAVASTTNSVTFNPTSSGTLSVTATNACGTSTSSTLALTVTSTPSSGTLSGTQDVCVGLTTAFSSTQSGGIWSTAVAGIATVDANTGLVTGAGSGTTTITYTVAGTGGCPDASATRTVTVTAAPVSGTLSADQDLCVGSTLTVTSSQAGGSWSTSSTGIATIDANTGLVSGVSAGSATMTYTVAGTGGCPDATASLLISVPLQLNSQDTLDYMICFGDSVLINSTYYSTPGLYTNTVTSSSGCDSIIYYLVYQDASAPQIVTCFQDTTIDVNDMCTAVVPDFTTSTSLLITDNCGSVSTGEIVVSQSPVAGTVISNDAAVVITVTDASGNSSSCSFSIVLKGCEINVLESLSPNNDGKNDYFVIENIDKFPGTSLRVFNRWGTEVYFSDDYKNTWNGTSQSKYNVGGDQLPEGTYYYLLELGGLETNSNYGELYKGYLYIKR